MGNNQTARGTLLQLQYACGMAVHTRLGDTSYRNLIWIIQWMCQMIASNNCVELRRIRERNAVLHRCYDTLRQGYSELPGCRKITKSDSTITPCGKRDRPRSQFYKLSVTPGWSWHESRQRPMLHRALSAVTAHTFTSPFGPFPSPLLRPSPNLRIPTPFSTLCEKESSLGSSQNSSPPTTLSSTLEAEDGAPSSLRRLPISPVPVHRRHCDLSLSRHPYMSLRRAYRQRLSDSRIYRPFWRFGEVKRIFAHGA